MDNLDLQTCCHPHQLLISITKPKNMAPSSRLQHWSHDQTPLQTSGDLNLPLNIEKAKLQLVFGFRDLGSFQIPVSAASSGEELHQYLTRANLSRQGEDQILSDSEVCSSVGSYLQNTPKGQSDVSVNLCSIEVLGADPSSLIKDRTVPVWKWVKRDHVTGIMMQGFWKPELEDVITDGDSRAGGGLSLLVRGVSGERAGELRGRMVIFPAAG